jgi:hypothetical protein
MSRGFAHPFLLIVVLVLVGVGVVAATSPKLSGLVLGAKNRKENIYDAKAVGLKVTVISPKASWDLVEYLCDTREQCQTSLTGGKWWATVSGAPTTQDGHEVFIEKAADWTEYSFLKLVVREAGVTGSYLHPTGSSEEFVVVSTEETANYPSDLEFK